LPDLKNKTSNRKKKREKEDRREKYDLLEFQKPATHPTVSGFILIGEAL